MLEHTALFLTDPFEDWHFMKAAGRQTIGKDPVRIRCEKLSF